MLAVVMTLAPAHRATTITVAFCANVGGEPIMFDAVELRLS